MVRIRHKVKELAPGLYSIREAVVRMFLIVGAERALLLDTALGLGDLPATLAGLTDLPLTVVCSHGHNDHTGGNHHFEQVYMHAADICRLSAPKQANLLPLADGQVFDLGGHVLETWHLPGHTAGQVLLFEPHEGWLFASDTLMDYPVNLGDFGALLPEYLASLETLYARRAQFKLILPAHKTMPLPQAAVGELLTLARAIATGALAGEEQIRSYDAKRCVRYTRGLYTIDRELPPQS